LTKVEMKIPFVKRTTAQRRDDTAAKLAEAEQQAKAAQEERVRLALAGEDTGPAEEAAWRLEARRRTSAEALVVLDDEIAAEAAAKAAAERKALRDKAIKKVRPWLERIKSLNVELAPLVSATQGLATLNDGCYGFAAGIFGPQGRDTLPFPLEALRI